MRDINLYPRKSFLEQYRKVVLFAIIAFGLLLLLFQFMISTGIVDESASAVRERLRTVELVEKIREQKKVDLRTTMYNSLLSQVESLKSSRNDWLTDLTYVLGYLPEGAVITSMNVSDAATLTTELKFAYEWDAVQYLARIQAEPRFRALEVTEFKKERTESAETNGTTGTESVEIVLPDYEDVTIPDPDPEPAEEETLTASELAIRELLLSNPDDLSERLKDLLDSEGGGSTIALDESSVWLQEDSPFSKDQVLNEVSAIEAERAASEREKQRNEPPVTLPDARSDTVEEVPPEREKVQPETPYVLQLRIPLHVKAVKP